MEAKPHLLEFIDTHAHLYLSQFDEDRAAVLARAADAGVQHIFLPHIDSSTTSNLYDVVASYPEQCHAMMGVHPCSIKENYKQELAASYQALQTKAHKFYAIGEIGLDYYWDISFKDEQQDALREQIGWAKEMQLPIVLHCRDSIDDTLAIVQELNDENLSGVFHCFGGSLEHAEAIIALGNFYLGIGGVVTYKKTNLPELLPQVPLKNIVLETDAPYLAPRPYRNKKTRRNESAFIPDIAARIAEVIDVPIEQVAELTTANAKSLFKI